MFRSLFCVLFMCYSVYRLCVCVLFCVPFIFMYYSVYCLCVFCVLYNCHRVSALLQFINNNNNHCIFSYEYEFLTTQKIKGHLPQMSETKKCKLAAPSQNNEMADNVCNVRIVN
jgi:hypothetical protein